MATFLSPVVKASPDKAPITVLYLPVVRYLPASLPTAVLKPSVSTFNVANALVPIATFLLPVSSVDKAL